MSVIKDDGTVVDIYHTDSALVEYVTLSEGLIVYDANDFYHARLIPEADVNAGLRYFRNANDVWFAPRFASPSYGGPSFQLHPTGGSPEQVLQWGNSVAIANSDRLNRAIVSDTYGVNNALANFTTSTYNTGWMNGDIKGAFLSDTDDTDLVGGELVTNGTFDTDTTGWFPFSNATLALNANRLEVTSDAGFTLGVGSTSLTTTAGKSYTVTVDVTAGTSANYQLWVGTSGTSAATYNSGNLTTFGTQTFVFTATTTTHWLNLLSVDDGGTTIFDNVSVTLADADRSVNNNGLQVFGTVTKDPVATGADLVGYSGFSSSNSLKQPYNSDLDFGTGDFCYMGWFYDGSVSGAAILTRNDGVGEAAKYGPGTVNILSNAGTLKLRLGNLTALNHTMTLGSLRWVHVVALRRSGIVELWVDGVLSVSSASSENLNLAGGALSFGQYFYNQQIGFLSTSSSLALWRISATAPTAEQIAKIYEDEKVLFQAGAQATLYGSSDAVTALAHDEDTDLLHVGTSAGRSVFNGLNRINNTTTGVTTAISAVNGIIGEQ